MAANNKTFQFKLVLLGESAVGKSSLVLRFVRGQFFDYQESTIGGERTSPETPHREPESGSHISILEPGAFDGIRYPLLPGSPHAARGPSGSAGKAQAAHRALRAQLRGARFPRSCACVCCAGQQPCCSKNWGPLQRAGGGDAERSVPRHVVERCCGGVVLAARHSGMKLLHSASHGNLARYGAKGGISPAVVPSPEQRPVLRPGVRQRRRLGLLPDRLVLVCSLGSVAFRAWVGVCCMMSCTAPMWTLVLRRKTWRGVPALT